MLSKEHSVDLVEILWDDAEAQAEWTTEEDDVLDEASSLSHTVGFLVKTTKTAYYISHTISMDADDVLHWNGRIRIPKGMVKTLKVLKKGE